MLLTKDQLLRGTDRRTIEVDVPELGGHLRLRAPSAAAALRARELYSKKDASESDLMRVMVAALCVDEKNEPLFTEDEAGKLLDAVSPATMGLLSEKFAELSGGGEPGNSEPSPSDS